MMRTLATWHEVTALILVVVYMLVIYLCTLQQQVYKSVLQFTDEVECTVMPYHFNYFIQELLNTQVQPNHELELNNTMFLQKKKTIK